MEFDLKLLSLLVWYAALNIRHIRDSELAPWDRHPCRPSVVAWPAHWMIGVAVAGTNVDAATSQGLHRSETDMGLFASMLSKVLRDQTDQRAHGAQVRLLNWQLNLD